MVAGKRKAVDDDDDAEWPSAPETYSAAASSSHPSALPRAPPAKKPRKRKDPDAPAPEKRGAMFKKKCPKTILERVERVTSQRFFMIDRRREGDALREEFSVLGSTGNVYTIVIDKIPSCNCPDATKGNHCKHILFIFLKVLQVTQASGYWYQKALLTSELEDIFSHAPPAPNSVAHERVRDAYARATGKAVAKSVAGPPKRRIPSPEDDCPICYENMHGVGEGTLAFCEECGNGLHKECFQQWATKCKNDLTCVFCRARWAVAPSAGGSSSSGGATRSEGYINLGGVAGVSPVRDTSSYYHDPSRGKPYYGYQDYDPYR